VLKEWYTGHLEVPQHLFPCCIETECPIREVGSEVAGDFYLIIIMVILMIIIILHHGADDYNHMGMKRALQLGLHYGGY